MPDDSRPGSAPPGALRAGRNEPDIFDTLGLTRVINVSGTETTLGASPVCAEVLEAVNALVPHSVRMIELQSVACHAIAAAFGTEAGLVANCTAAGIAIAVAACMAGEDLGRAEQLPDTTGMRRDAVLQRGHNVTYGGNIAQNIRMTGARLIEIGAATECGAYQLEHAITDETACGVYVVSHHTVQSGLIDLETFCRVCHARGVPVIVDGAAEPEPRQFLRAGADLVITSMHKQFASLTGATIAGRLDLVRACHYQDRGIGRPMKVGKEGVVATIAAVRRWAALDHARVGAALDAKLERGRARLAALPGITPTIERDSTSGLFARLLLHVDASRAGLTAFALADALARERPSIAVRSLMAELGLLQLGLRRASDEIAGHVFDRIAALVAEASAGGPVATGAGPVATPNLADLARAGLERFPLPAAS